MKLKTLREVTLSKYQELQKIDEPTDIQILTILFGYKEEQLRKAKQSKVQELIQHINKELTKENKLINVLELNGIEFGFIPNLDEITYGENSDITEYINDWATMHKAMAVLYRPITTKHKNQYLIEKYTGTEQYAELMKDAPLDVVISMMVFFYNLTKELLNYIPSYLQQQMLKKETLKAFSQKNGDDIQKSLHLLKETCEDLTKLQNSIYSNV